jgi:hypothetical protein
MIQLMNQVTPNNSSATGNDIHELPMPPTPGICNPQRLVESPSGTDQPILAAHDPLVYTEIAQSAIAEPLESRDQLLITALHPLVSIAPAPLIVIALITFLFTALSMKEFLETAINPVEQDRAD